MSPGEATLLCGWGRTAPSRARLERARDGRELQDALARAHACSGGVIARGAGRSYGDAAQNGGGAVLDMTALDGAPLLVDARGNGSPLDGTPLVRAAAGTTLARLLLFLAERGLTLPVVPGTRHVTVGGAIASDVHGKNHPRDGSLARHVALLTLCTPAGGTAEVTARSDSELFAATAGGMGLTGVIESAVLRTMPLPRGDAAAEIDRTATLEDAIALMDGDGHRYQIAWCDLLCRGGGFGRAVVTRCHGVAGDCPPFAPAARASVPAGFPGGVLRPATVRAFNELHWRAAPRRGRERPLPMSAHLFPLDALGHWNRLYGRGGLLQYQFAVPRGREGALLGALQELRRHRTPMYLAVLKRLGAGQGMLSFPLEGWTMAVDIPATAPGLYAALDRVDELIAGAGGRVYLAKDSRLRRETLAAMYPQLPRFMAVRRRVDPDGVLRSDMAARLGLCG